jgi:hypothetical protein
MSLRFPRLDHRDRRDRPYDEEPTPPHPSDVAARALAERESWPRPGGLAGLVRRLAGRPETTGSDEIAMRADIERLVRRVVEEHRRTSEPRTPAGLTMFGDADPEPDVANEPARDRPPHPGLLELVARSDRRTRQRTVKPARRLGGAVARVTKAQAAFNRDVEAREEGRQAVESMPASLSRPTLGTAMTRSRTVWALLILVLIPIEAMLTYQQLLVLGMSDFRTGLFAALIGASIAVVAEVVGALGHLTATHANLRDQSRQQRGMYWIVTAFTVVIVGVGVYTLSQMASAREHNQSIVQQRQERVQQRQEQVGQNGFLEGTATTPNVSSGSAGERAADQSNIDLTWTFGLQLLVFLAAVGVTLRQRMADEYNEVEIDRRRRLRAARMAESRVRRSEARVAGATGAYESTMRAIRLVVEEERALLIELLERVRSGVRAHEPDLSVALPPLRDIEVEVDDAITPRLPDVGQPAVAGTPEPEQPPHTRSRPRPDTPHTADVPDAGRGPLWVTQPGWNHVESVGWVYIPAPGEVASGPANTNGSNGATHQRGTSGPIPSFEEPVGEPGATHVNGATEDVGRHTERVEDEDPRWNELRNVGTPAGSGDGPGTRPIRESELNIRDGREEADSRPDRGRSELTHEEGDAAPGLEPPMPDPLGGRDPQPTSELDDSWALPRPGDQEEEATGPSPGRGAGRFARGLAPPDTTGHASPYRDALARVREALIAGDDD